MEQVFLLSPLSEVSLRLAGAAIYYQTYQHHSRLGSLSSEESRNKESVTAQQSLRPARFIAAGLFYSTRRLAVIVTIIWVCG